MLSLWETLVSWVDFLKPYLREETFSLSYGSLPCFWDIIVETWGEVYYERPVLGGDRLGEHILTSSTSLVFIKDCLGSISRGEEDRDSEWVSRLGGIGGVEGLGYTGIGEKDIRAGSFIPKGLGANDSISGISLLRGLLSLG